MNNLPKIEGVGNAEPALSVIIAADRYQTISQTIRHLRAQTSCHQLELVVVSQSAEHLALDLTETAGFCRVLVVEVSSILPLARATSAGIRRATAPLVVLAESHAFPAPGWAQALIEAHLQPSAAVGAVIRNANPGLLSWAGLFVDYGRCVETASVENATYLPGHHTAYKRDVLLHYDAQLEAMMDSEILLHWDMRARGHQLRIEPKAQIYHANISRFGASVRERFYSGRRFAATRSRNWPLMKRFIYAGGSPLIPVVRIIRACGDLIRSTFPARRWLLILPSIIVDLAASATGELFGYLLGPGNAMIEAAKMELFKMNYLTTRDRQKLEAWSLEVSRQAGL